MTLPAEAEPYRRTPVFDETTLPAALRSQHSTKEGVWGLIHVLEGKLAFRISDPRRLVRTQVLTPEGAPGVIEPTIAHSVAPLGSVRFYVEFHRCSATRRRSSANEESTAPLA